MSQAQLIGTSWRFEPAGGRSFACPRCEGERPAVGTRLRRRLTILGHEVAPLGREREFLTCEACGHAFAADPLHRPDLAEDELALLSLVAGVVFSDSVVRRSEKEVSRAVIRRYLGHRPPEAIDEMLRYARGRWGDPVARLTRLRGLVPTSTRRRLIEAAYLVCTADGELHRQESRLLDRIGEALDLSPREIRHAVAAARRHPAHSTDGKRSP